VATEEQEIIYTKRPLVVVVPHLGDKQFNKNPFTKSLRFNNFVLFRCGSFAKCHNILKDNLRSDTIEPYTARKFPRPDFVPIPSHNNPPIEVTEEQHDRVTEIKTEKTGSLEEMKKETLVSSEVICNLKVVKSMQLATETEVNQKLITLPFNRRVKRESNKTLLLDLDNTLVHTINPSFDYSFTSLSQDRIKTVFYKSDEQFNFNAIKVIIRPNAIKFLKEISKIYEIIVLLV
jgi:hypothetical protein